MRMSDQVSLPDTTELTAVDQLISDLAALLDAGLVVVHDDILGPARYGVALARSHAEGRPT